MDTHARYWLRKPAPGALQGTRMRGQALVFTLVFAASAGLVSLLLFNSGLLANTKTGLQNAADAGAYSAALLQARDHNFSAYTNRAMVANQVAVAQLVSMKSYLEDAANTHSRMSNWLHVLQSFIPVSKREWDAAGRIPIERTSSSYAAIAGPSVTALDRLIRILESAQNIHHTATATTMLAVADEVVRRNDPQARVTTSSFMLGNSVYQIRQWQDDYTARHRANDPSAAADRFADVVVSDESTDLFTRNRLSSPRPSWSSSVKRIIFPCWTMISSSTMYRFAHAGGTLLSSDKRRWLAMDATLGGGFYTCKIITFWGVRTFWWPLLDGFGGSGGAVAGAGGPYGELVGYRNNPWNTIWYGGAVALFPPGPIRYRRGPGATLDASGGLQDYYRDVRQTTATPTNQTPEQNGGAYPVTIEVERRGATVRTSAKLLPDATTVKLEDGFKGDTMRTLASAHAYFYRSNVDGAGFTRGGWRRNDGRTEMANLFNPYWQARLVDTSIAEVIASRSGQ
jgi:hypothetical protein